jgi:hypothetical protein
MRLQRKVFVTIGLAGIGAAVGTIAGVAFAGIAFATSSHRSAELAAEVFKLGTQSGAFCGAVLGPLTAFTILRRVPLGRFLWHGALGASLGAIAGIVAQRLDSAPGHSLALILAMSVGGFGLAATHLWWCFRERTARLVGASG